MTTDEQVNDFLEHFGVKGMRWGVRQEQKRQEHLGRVSRVADGTATAKERGQVKRRSGTITKKSAERELRLYAKKEARYKKAGLDYGRGQQRDASTAAKVQLGVAAATIVLPVVYHKVSALVNHVDQNPERYIPAARFAGNASRTPMRVARVAAKGIRILFDRSGGMSVHVPGTFSPGQFKDATYIPRALGTASQFVYRGHVR